MSSDVHQELLKNVIKEEASIFTKHNSRLISMISKDIEVSPESIIDFDLCFADGNKSSYVGLDEDFISSPRLDNLFSSFHGTLKLTKH